MTRQDVLNQHANSHLMFAGSNWQTETSRILDLYVLAIKRDACGLWENGQNRHRRAPDLIFGIQREIVLKLYSAARTEGKAFNMLVLCEVRLPYRLRRIRLQSYRRRRYGLIFIAADV